MVSQLGPGSIGGSPLSPAVVPADLLHPKTAIENREKNKYREVIDEP